VPVLRAWLSRGGQTNAPLIRSVAETWTPLMLACAEGDVALVRVIVETGGGRASASIGTKVLADVSSALLELGAAVDARDSIGMTPLHYAAGHGHLRTIEVLLGAGADTSPLSESPGGATAVDLAEMAGFNDAAALVKDPALVRAPRDGVSRREALGLWLRSLGCEEFLGRFLRAGYDDLSFLASQGMTDADLDCVGVPNERLGLRKKLLTMHGVDAFLDDNGVDGGSGTEEASAPETASESGPEGGSSGSGSDISDLEDANDADDSGTDDHEHGSGSDDDGGSGNGSGGSDSESDT